MTETPIEACQREGHDPTIGLRHDEMRRALVADCRRCGAVLVLEQTATSDDQPTPDDGGVGRGNTPNREGRDGNS